MSTASCRDPLPRYEPLRYPSHYPPRSWRHRFFIGVRGLGPDLSFFEAMAAMQALRSLDLMDAWGGGERQRVATGTGAAFARHLGWRSACFLPEDSVQVIAGGPAFVPMDGDIAVERAIDEIEERLGLHPPEAFWQRAGAGDLGTLIDQLMPLPRT